MKTLQLLLPGAALLVVGSQSWSQSVEPRHSLRRADAELGLWVGCEFWSPPALSADGRYVSYVTFAYEGSGHTFVYDFETGENTRVSVGPDGELPDDEGIWSAISAGGRYVAFDSRATNLVLGDTNFRSDVFVHDRMTAETERVSVSTGGVEANEASHLPSITADGRFVAFVSGASNLVRNDTNHASDVFLHDTWTGETLIVGLSSEGDLPDLGVLNASISGDGISIVFDSFSSNLVPDDTNGIRDVFVRDLQTGITTRVSVDSIGNEANNFAQQPSISGTGRFVTFMSNATNLVPGVSGNQIYVHDRTTGQTSVVSVASNAMLANDTCVAPRISANGRYVVFRSRATNLVLGDTNGFEDIFVHDRVTGRTRRLSVGGHGQQSNEHSDYPAISRDGRHVAFVSCASNLVPDDTNFREDLFLHSCPQPIRIVAEAGERTSRP